MAEIHTPSSSISDSFLDNLDMSSLPNNDFLEFAELAHAYTKTSSTDCTSYLPKSHEIPSPVTLDGTMCNIGPESMETGQHCIE
jgi:hypothetical protein